MNSLMPPAFQRTSGRILNKLFHPFGLRVVPHKDIPPAPELTEAHLVNAKLLPNRTDILYHLGTDGVVAEIGVAFGSFSRQILRVMKPARFVAIDIFELDSPSWTGRRPYQDKLKGVRHEDFCRREFSAEIASGQVEIRKGWSHEELARFDDCTFNMVYIDAAHDYESVKRDLAVANRKVKRDGYIVLNDFTVMDPLLLQHYDITRATQEFCLEHGWEFVYLALHRHMFCDVALRRMS